MSDLDLKPGSSIGGNADNEADRVWLTAWTDSPPRMGEFQASSRTFFYGIPG